MNFWYSLTLLELRQTSLQLESERKESENLRIQLEKALKETEPLKEALETAQLKLISLQRELEIKDAQLNSTRAYNTQLKAELQESLSKQDDLEQSRRELAKLKKDFVLR